MRKHVVIIQVVITIISLKPQSLSAQSTTRLMALSGGISHITMLDKQATPLVYTGMGPRISLGSELLTCSHGDECYFKKW